MAGWIKLHRRIVDSEIYVMPPLYLRVFERMIIEANHADNEIPYKEKGAKTIGKKLIRRGERLTSIRQICEWVGWYERGIFKTPNPKTIKTIIDWLEENGMIEILNQGNRTETHYKVLNYNVYQDDEEVKVTPKKRPSNAQVTPKKQSADINKNDKNEKNDKKDLKEEEDLHPNPFDFYQQNGFGFLTPVVVDDMNQWLDGKYFDQPKEILIEAMKEAALRNKTYWKYASAILMDWNGKGLRTLADVQANQTRWKQQGGERYGKSSKSAGFDTRKDHEGSPSVEGTEGTIGRCDPVVF